MSGRWARMGAQRKREVAPRLGFVGPTPVWARLRVCGLYRQGPDLAAPDTWAMGSPSGECLGKHAALVGARHGLEVGLERRAARRDERGDKHQKLRPLRPDPAYRCPGTCVPTPSRLQVRAHKPRFNES